MKKIGVIIGRFQVDELHSGHIKLIEYVMERSYWTCILLGTSQIFSRRNPLNFCQRKAMIKESFKNLSVYPLPNVPDNKDWSDRLDSLLESLYPGKQIILYYGRDSFIDAYSGKFQTKLVEFDSADSGSNRRKDCVTPFTKDARCGIINASELIYPTSYQTVDIAVFKKDKVLLCKKSCYDKWVFPGGFVDPTDQTLEHAAHRELEEETNIETGTMKYIGSFRIPDWRFRGTEHAIMTAAFSTTTDLDPKPTAEIKEFKYMTIQESIENIHSDHYSILEAAWKI